MVVGSRFLGEGKYKQSVSRLVGIGILSTLIRLLSGLPVTDCTSGFRVINRRVIQAFAHWYPDDYPEPEVILLLHRSGFKITEVGVKMRQRRAGMTSIPLMRGLFYVLKVSTALLLDMARDPWPSGKLSGGKLPGGKTSRENPPISNPSVKASDHDPQPDIDTLRRNPAAAGGPAVEAVQA